MKELVVLAMFGFAFVGLAAELDRGLLDAMGEDRTRWVALSRGAEAKECFRIVDSEGNPVTNANICCAFKVSAGASGLQDVYGVTDTNGLCTIIGMCKAYMDYRVDKEGYYCSRGKVDYMETTRIPAVIDGKWQPYGETRTVELKKIKNPGVLKVPSKLIQVETSIPVYGEWLPFDLEKFDWVKPHGKGDYDDVLLRFRRRITGKWYDFTYEMDVSFTNQPFAGAVVMAKDCNSDFTTVYTADTNATYNASFNYFLEHTKKSGSKSSVLDKDFYLIFRTRTTVDEDGKLKTVHYGTIHGEWSLGESYMIFADGCFNPTPNDTNIEDGCQLREVLQRAK